MKTLPSGVIITDMAMSDDVDKYCRTAAELHLDRRALIFLEEAIASYNGRHGIKKTRQYLQYMLDYLEEFETEERNTDV